MYVHRSPVFGLAERDISCCAVEIRSCLRDLFLPRAAHEFVEACLRLCNDCLGFCEARARTGIVLAQDELPCCNVVAFRDQNLENRFVHLGDEFDSVGGQLADDSIAVGVVPAGAQKQAEGQDDS